MLGFFPNKNIRQHLLELLLSIIIMALLRMYTTLVMNVEISIKFADNAEFERKLEIFSV